jgi:ferredoxin-NADP reductase
MSKNTELVFEKMIKETSDIFSFVFEVPEEFAWLPGQHGIFRFKEEIPMEGKDFRIYSFASIKEENKMLFSTRIVDNPSDFKKHLLKLKTGDVMTVDAARGKFLLEDYQRPILIMAGGIGITPVRAFVKAIENEKPDIKDLRILYSDDRGEFAYKDVFDVTKEKYKGLDIELISDREVFTNEIDDYAKKMKNKSLYYISGTPGMVNFLTEKLEGFGIEKKNIVTDAFAGY